MKNQVDQGSSLLHDDEELKRRLLRVATSLFASKGFDATSVQDVVAAAGVTKGAMYYYYSGKDELLYEICRVGQELEKGREIVALGLDPAETLRMLVGDLIASVTFYQPETKVAWREMHRLKPEHFDLATAEKDEYFELFRTVIEAGQASKQFWSGVDPTVAALAIFGTCVWMSNWFRPDGRLSVDEISEQLTELLMSGLALRE